MLPTGTEIYRIIMQTGSCRQLKYVKRPAIKNGLTIVPQVTVIMFQTSNNWLHMTMKIYYRCVISTLIEATLLN